MLDAVMQANLIAKKIGFGIGADGMMLSVDPPGCRERVGLTAEGFERVCTQTAAWVQDLKQSYGFRN